MPKYLIISRYDEDVHFYYTEKPETITVVCATLRDFDHPYEIYQYDAEYGYQRTTCWPAQI